MEIQIYLRLWMRMYAWLFQPLCYLWGQVNVMLLCQFHQKLFHVFALYLQFRQFTGELRCMHLQRGGKEADVKVTKRTSRTWRWKLKWKRNKLYRKACNCSLQISWKYVILCSWFLQTPLRYLYEIHCILLTISLCTILLHYVYTYHFWLLSKSFLAFPDIVNWVPGLCTPYCLHYLSPQEMQPTLKADKLLLFANFMMVKVDFALLLLKLTTDAIW